MKHLILSFYLLVTLTFAATTPLPSWQPIIPNKIPDAFQTVDQIDMQGLLGQRVLINQEKRLLQIDSATLLSGFKKRPGSQVWIGEHVGKFLFSASLTYKYTRNPALKQLLDEMVTKYIAYQLPDGYLGTYLPKDYWTEWDVWAHKYAIIGLLNYYSITGSPAALQAAKRAADLICTTFGDKPGQRDIITAGHHVGMAPGSILEPMVDLYRYTGNTKYLDFAKYILAAWEGPNGPKIMENMAKFGTVNKVGNAKAYEMMSCFVGIAKYYKLSGNEIYKSMLEKAWKDIRLNRMYITGTASDHEHFQADDHLMATNEDHMGEGCVTTTWIQFSHQMLLITGNLIYLEEIERSIYNHLFAAENPQTGCVSYYTALIGPKPHKCDQGYSCCLSSIPRGISMIPQLVAGTIKGTFTIMQYESGTYIDTIAAESGKRIALKITAQSEVPLEGTSKFTISVSEKAPFTLAFRTPQWSASCVIMVNGAVVANPAIGSTATIRRTWNSGDQVEVRFSIPLQVIHGGRSYPGSIAFKRGPQVLAADLMLNSWAQSLSAIDLKQTTDFKLMDGRNALPEKWNWRQAYFMPIVQDGATKTLVLVPFAEAGQFASDLTVWLKKSNMQFK